MKSLEPSWAVLIFLKLFADILKDSNEYLSGFISRTGFLRREFLSPTPRAQRLIQPHNQIARRQSPTSWIAGIGPTSSMMRARKAACMTLSLSGTPQLSSSDLLPASSCIIRTHQMCALSRWEMP